jgi:hypothetical protein
LVKIEELAILGGIGYLVFKYMSKNGDSREFTGEDITDEDVGRRFFVAGEDPEPFIVSRVSRPAIQTAGLSEQESADIVSDIIAEQGERETTLPRMTQDDPFINVLREFEVLP